MITMFHDERGWEIWSDTGDGPKDGRCIGAGKTLAKAFQMAELKLMTDLGELRDLKRQDKERL